MHAVAVTTSFTTKNRVFQRKSGFDGSDKEAYSSHLPEAAMAKSVNVQYDKDGNPTVSMTELPPVRPVPPASPKKRIPSSPHKPFQSSNFYDLTSTTPETTRKSAADTSIVDLTKSNSSSPEVVIRGSQRPNTSGGIHVGTSGFTRPQTSYNNPKSTENDRRQTIESSLKQQDRQTSSGFRALQQMDRQSNTVLTIPGPYASKHDSQKSSHTPAFSARKRSP